MLFTIDILGMKKNKVLIFLVLAILFTACKPRHIIYYIPNHGEILLSNLYLYDAKPPFNHPYKFTRDEISSMMRSLTCNGQRIFSEGEVREFSKPIAKAFAKAIKETFVSFYISERGVRSISGGEIYVKGERCIWFFYAPTEVFSRSPIIAKPAECLANKKYLLDLKKFKKS
jgi:hypothetical protein